MSGGGAGYMSPRISSPARDGPGKIGAHFTRTFICFYLLYLFSIRFLFVIRNFGFHP
jgi:hypothetical protein